jgi:hypothetical protein
MSGSAPPLNNDRLVRTTRSNWKDRMNTLLWVLQVLLALAFFAHGCLFLFPPAAVVEQMNASLPRWFQLFVGLAENIGGRGADASGFHAHSAVARLLCGGWHHDRDDFCHDFSSVTW